MDESVIENQLPISLDEIGSRGIFLQSARVLIDVVAGVEGQDYKVWRISPDSFPQTQKFLRGGEAIHAKVHYLDALALQRGAAGQLAFQDRGVIFFHRYLESLGIGVAENGDAESIWRLLQRVFVIAQTLTIDVDEDIIFRSVPKPLRPGTRRDSGMGIPDEKQILTAYGIAHMSDAKTDFYGDQGAHEQRDPDQHLSRSGLRRAWFHCLIESFECQIE